MNTAQLSLMFDVHGGHYGISIEPIKIAAAVEVVHKKMNELRQIKSGTFFDICGPVTFFWSHLM